MLRQALLPVFGALALAGCAQTMVPDPRVPPPTGEIAQTIAEVEVRLAPAIGREITPGMVLRDVTHRGNLMVFDIVTTDDALAQAALRNPETVARFARTAFGANFCRGADTRRFLDKGGQIQTTVRAPGGQVITSTRVTGCT